MFVEILTDQKKDTFIRRDAAFGLGRLQDTASVDIIISVAEREGRSSELNIRPYLEALSLMGGDKAKQYVQKFENSKEQTVRKLVRELLDKW